IARDFDRTLDERRLEEQVLGRISGDHHLGEGEHLDALGASPLDGLDDERGVAGEISDRGIELGESEAELSHGRAIVAAERTRRKHTLFATNESARPWTGRSRS